MFAPEAAIAAFGGDPDNFQFPRWCLDMSLLRAYDNGKPAQTPNHLTINCAGRRGQPVFVSGHPGRHRPPAHHGRSSRPCATRSAVWLLRYSELRGRLIQFAKTSPEALRTLAGRAQSLENSIKVRRKQLDTLLDDELMEQARQRRGRAAGRGRGEPELKATTGTPGRTSRRRRRLSQHPACLTRSSRGGAGFNSRLFRYARALVRGAAERASRTRSACANTRTPRCRRSSSSSRPPTPIYPELESSRCRSRWSACASGSAPTIPWCDAARHRVARLPRGLPRRRARSSAIRRCGCALGRRPGRGRRARRSDDPARAARRSRGARRAQAPRGRSRGPDRSAPGSDRAGALRGAGHSVYPDATFTLRLNYGTVQGWDENGKPVEPFTRLGAFERATGQRAVPMPPSWQKPQGHST